MDAWVLGWMDRGTDGLLRKLTHVKRLASSIANVPEMRVYCHQVVEITISEFAGNPLPFSAVNHLPPTGLTLVQDEASVPKAPGSTPFVDWDCSLSSVE